jgi:hypothetical protein
MNQSMKVLSLFLACAVASAACSQVQFTHLKSADLSPYFTHLMGLGDSVSDIAYDGSNLYIAGFSTLGFGQGEPTEANVGVLKVTYGLSLGVNVLSFDNLISLNQRAQSRVSYVAYRDGFLYLGTGLGHTSNDPALTAVRKFNAADGSPISNWNISGSVVPSDLSGSARMECLSIDPRSGAPAILCRGRGLTFRRDATSGAGLPNILNVPTRPNNTTTTGVRDIAFAPNGDIYARVDNSVYYGSRTADNTIQGGILTQIIDFESDNSLQVLINVEYMVTSCGDRLVLNRRTGDANNRITRVLIYAKNTDGNWVQESIISGNEILPDGTQPSAFGFDIFNFTSGIGTDPTQGDVNLDGIVDDADLLEILFNFGSDNPELDTNYDGTVDDADLLTVLFNFGSQPRALYLFIISTNLGSDRLDIYRVSCGGGE